MGRTNNVRSGKKRPLDTTKWEKWGFAKLPKLETDVQPAKESQENAPKPVIDTSQSTNQPTLTIEIAVATTEPAKKESTASRSRSENLIRGVLNEMTRYARSAEYSSLAMNSGFADILRNEDLEEIVQKLLRGLTPKTRSLLDKERWDYDDILQLPSATNKHHFQGIYGIFARGHKPKAAGYVGSTGDIWKRWNEHKQFLKDTQGRLKGTNDYKYHYFRKYFTIDELEYKILARFNVPIEEQYLLLLEGIFAIIFSAMYSYPDGNVPTNRQAAINLINNIHFTYTICSPLWGLNMKWPISQQCPHPMRSMELPCQNPACGRMTYPPMGKKSHPRVPFDQNDITKGFLCGYCQDWKLSHQNQLPSKQQITIHQAKNDGTHPKDRCEHCNDTAPNRDYSLHSELIMTLCAACRKFYKENNKKLPSEAVLRERERRRQKARNKHT
jgi:hypothetical protein